MTNYTKKFIYPLFETILIEYGKTPLLHYHQLRVNHVFNTLFKIKNPFQLVDLIPKGIDKNISKTKWRFLYNSKYHKNQHSIYSGSNNKHFKVKEQSNLSYPFKWSERIQLNRIELLDPASHWMISENGRLKDFTFGNIAMKINDQWFTPTYPLFYGVQRQHLIESKILQPKDLFEKHIPLASQIKLINAMNNLDDSPNLLFIKKRIQY